MATDQSFENLTHGKLLVVPNKEDKNVSLTLEAWGGNTSISVFTGAGGKPWKHPLPEQTRENIILLLEYMRDNPQPKREVIMLQQWDQDNKKWKQNGQIGIGLDEKLNLFIDVAHNDLPNRYQFFFRSQAKFDFLQTSLTERDHLKGMINWLITVLRIKCLIAERFTSFKRPPMGGGGGNRGGGNYGGGGGNRGNYGGGGGGGNYGGGGGGGQRQGGTFGGVDAEEMNLI